MIIKYFLCVAVLLCPSLALAQQARQERVEQRVSLETDDGWKLNARYLNSSQNAPTIVLLHDRRGDLSEWELWFPYLKRYGYGYLALDLRGHGFSFILPNGSSTTYRAFNTSGPDNEFNRMTRDAEAAIAYLAASSVTAQNIVLVGAGLGANLAIKTAAINQDISMVAAISPALNVNDVLSINPLRAYGKRPLLLVTGADRARQYKEFQLINDIAKAACGKENVSVIIEAKGAGAGLINKYNIKLVLDWLRNPRLPQIIGVSTSAVRADDAAPENPQPQPALQEEDGQNEPESEDEQ